MTTLKVVSTYPFSAASQEVLREAAAAEMLFLNSADELRANLPETEILCAFNVPHNWRELASNLRWLQYPGAGVDALKPTGLLDEGSNVIVTTAAGIHATSISEYVFGSMLMFNWHWPQMLRLQERHVWARSANWYHLGGRELAGQTLGIVGLGNIGRRIAQLGHAFEMRVLGMRRSAQSLAPHDTQPPGTSSEPASDDVDQLYTREQLHEMLRECDYVVISVPLTPETEKMIGEAELRVMKSNAYLVNIARGHVVDEQALIRALQEGWIAGAGLDVAEKEPLPGDSPLYSLPNVILTPHIAGASNRYDERLAALFADNLRRFRAGKPLRNRYEPARGY